MLHTKKIGTKESESSKQQKVIDSSKQLFESIGLEDKVDFRIRKVELKTLPGFTSLFESGFENKDVLVILHSFPASNIMWFKQIPELIKKFHVIALDLYGFGASYRHDITFKDSDHVIDVYTRSIHETIEALSLESYYIAGLSLGGYLTSHFQHRYKPDNVKGVILISPAGTIAKPDGAETRFLEKHGVTNTPKQKMIKFFAYLIFERKWSPLDLVPFVPYLYGIKKYFELHPQYKFTEKEQELLINYFKAVCDYGAEVPMSILGHLLDWGNWSKLPSGIHFNEIMTKYNFVVFFGERDWMQKEPVQEIIEKLPENHKCEGIHIISNAGHAPNFENPQETNEKIFKFCELFKKKDEQNLL